MSTRFSDDELLTIHAFYVPPYATDCKGVWGPTVESYHQDLGRHAIFFAWRTLVIAEAARASYGAEKRSIPRVWEPIPEKDIPVALVDYHFDHLRRKTGLWCPGQIRAMFEKDGAPPC